MKDLKKDSEYDVAIAGNDLVIGVSDRQHQEDLLLIEKGAVKQYPDAGVGSHSFLESEEVGLFLREVSLQFSADGMKVKSVGFKDGKLLIDAPYEN